jgi:xanthine/uracil permease
VGYSGLRIVRTGSPDKLDWSLVAVSTGGGLLVSALVGHLSFLPPGLVTVMQFPVTTGAFIALCIEVVRFFHGKKPQERSTAQQKV